MDNLQISESLQRIFKKSKSRIVFWHDAEKEFEETVKVLDLPEVTILRQDEHSALELKIRLELEDTEGKYLLYAPFPEPVPQEDWLLDIRLYNHTFLADRASIILNELGLKSQALRPYLSARKDFFRSQERLNKFKKWVNPTDGESDLDLKMLAVLTKADQPEIFAILMKLFDSFCEDGSFNPDLTSRLWGDIEKYNLAPVFWKLISRSFGYSTETPKLKDLLVRLLVTDFAASLRVDLPASIQHFKLESGGQVLNASVFISQWRNNLAHFQNFNLISKHYAKELKIEELVQSIDVNALLEVMTFEAVEQRIIRTIRDQILADQQDDFDYIPDIIQKRLSGYWAGPVVGDANKTNLYRTTYQALEIALELFHLRKKYDSGFSYPNPETMFKAYMDELYLFDQYYRKFHVASEKIELGGWDILKSLQAAVEDCYSGWFMDQLSLSWGSFMEAEGGQGLINTWTIPDVRSQSSFYSSYIKNVIESSPRKKVFVIVSDAFRFEAAEELTRDINGRYRFQAELESMLGVLPSYTALGMAALLPHKSITLNESGDLQVNGKSVASLDQRTGLLVEYEGTAIRADELLAILPQPDRRSWG